MGTTSRSKLDQSVEESNTDVVSAYDQSFSVSEDGKPLPVVRGERKVAGRYVISPFYGQRSWTEGGGTGKGASKGGGGGGTTYYAATIACAVAKGPVQYLRKILLNSEVVYEGDMSMEFSSNPTIITTKYGKIEWYWGTEDQPASSHLNGFEAHPPYKGVCYCVFVDFNHKSSTSAYNAEFIVSSACEQSIVVNTMAAYASRDSGITVNPIVFACEVLTSPNWLGLSSSDLVASTFQASAGTKQADLFPSFNQRSKSSVSPLIDSQADIRGVLSDIAALADAWLRVNTAGKVECGLWIPPASYTTLNFSDLDDVPKVDIDDKSDVANSYAVTFTDREALHKEAKIIVDDVAALAAPGVKLKRNTVDASMLVTYAQALWAGSEAIRKAALGGTWTGSVRYGRAKTPAGVMLQPGDYLSVPVSAPSETVVHRLIRVEKVTYPKNATSPVKIVGRYEPPTAGSDYTTTSTDPALEAAETPIPPIALARAFSLPSPGAGKVPVVHVVACRPMGTAIGYQVHYDDDSAGDFPSIASCVGFQLPMTLDATVTAAATTLRLSLRANGSRGEVFTRDSNLIANWSGGATEARNDSLIVVLVAKDGAGAQTAIEVCSVNGAPSLVDADTFDVSVLRGRLGTTAKAWTSGAWSSVEAWVCDHGSMPELAHVDITDAFTNASRILYFRPIAFSGRLSYSPADAYAEAARLSAASLPLLEYAAQSDDSTWKPTLSTNIPAGYDVTKSPPAAVTGVTIYSAAERAMPPRVKSAGTLTPVPLGCTIVWNPSTESDLSHYEIYQKLNNSTAPASNDPNWLTVVTPEAHIYTEMFYGVFVWIRAVDVDGNKGPMVATGNIFANMSPVIGTMSLQDNTATKVAGIQTGATSASSVQKVLARYPVSVVHVTVGGATEESVSISLSGRGFSTRPDVAPFVFGSYRAGVDAQYDYDSSTSSNAVFKLFRLDGAAFAAGLAYRLNIEFVEYD